MTIEIEHGLPMPSTGGRPTDPGYALLDRLKIGDSVFLPGKQVQSVKTYLASKRFKYLRDQGFAFAAAEATKDGLAGVRVWRR